MEETPQAPEREYLTKVGYQTWGGNEYCKTSVVKAKSEQEALDKLAKCVKERNFCKKVVWGSSKKNIG